jgi:hypothetical protein
MINRINELRNKATERAEYYASISFINLATEFTQLVNILNEMEAIVRERDELKAEKERIMQVARDKRDSEVYD